jgi:pyruvate dehydrogenase E2 component (dihydrolipoamide acetyltransferase)
MIDIKIPDLGDGIGDATVLSVLVSVGDTVEKEDTIIELETDKAVAPVPSPGSGTIGSIVIKEGDSVSTGTKIGTLSNGDGGTPTESTVSEAVSDGGSVLSPSASSSSLTSVVTPASYTCTSSTYTSSGGSLPPAAPSIRRFAVLSGLDLSRIQGTGRGGRVTWADVTNYVTFLQSSVFNASPVSEIVSEKSETPKPLAVDFSKWGEVEIQPVASIRKKISANLRHTWQVTPHVTQFDDADITDLMDLRKKYNPKYVKQGCKLTLTVFAIKAVVAALKQFPQFNASFDEAKGELIFKKYYHIGIAVDTENGLMVPVIRNVDDKSLVELSCELNEIAEKARHRKITVDEMQGSSFTISNLGGLGVGSFTPIINAPDVAILGLGRGQLSPQFDAKNTLSSRLRMPVCLSYDHRVIDGADGARFTRAVIDQFESFPEAFIKESLK